MKVQTSRGRAGDHRVGPRMYVPGCDCDCVCAPTASERRDMCALSSLSRDVRDGDWPRRPIEKVKVKVKVK